MNSDLSEMTISKYFTAMKPSALVISQEGHLYHHRRVLSDGQLLFIVNSSLEKPLKGSIKIKGADAGRNEYTLREKLMVTTSVR